MGWAPRPAPRAAKWHWQAKIEKERYAGDVVHIRVNPRACTEDSLEDMYNSVYRILSRHQNVEPGS